MFNKFILFVNHCQSISFKKAKVNEPLNKISKGAILMWKVQNDSTPCSNARCQKLAKSAYDLAQPRGAGAAQLSTVSTQSSRDS